MHARSGGRVIYIGAIGLCERAGMAIPQGRGLRQPGRQSTRQGQPKGPPGSGRSQQPGKRRSSQRGWLWEKGRQRQRACGVEASQGKGQRVRPESSGIKINKIINK